VIPAFCCAKTLRRCLQFIASCMQGPADPDRLPCTYTGGAVVHPPCTTEHQDGQGHAHGGRRARMLEAMYLSTRVHDLLPRERANVHTAHRCNTMLRGPPLGHQCCADEPRWRMSQCGGTEHIESRSSPVPPPPPRQPPPALARRVVLSSSRPACGRARRSVREARGLGGSIAGGATARGSTHARAEVPHAGIHRGRRSLAARAPRTLRG